MKAFCIGICTLIFGASAAFGQIDLTSILGEYHVDLTAMKPKLQGTRAGEERFSKLEKDELILILFMDYDVSEEVYAVMYNMDFNPEEPIWFGTCYQGSGTSFTIQLREEYDGRPRVYLCSYMVVQGVGTINIDPFFAHMSVQPNTGNDLIMIVQPEE